jgi:two-component system response regulator BaeR
MSTSLSKLSDATKPAVVMVVEDDAMIADMVTNYLHAKGFSTRWLENGKTAVDAIRSEPPDVILLDLMLPGLDGMEVCRRVRAFSAVPIIMMTARVDEIDRLLGLELGADDYVCKPFSPRELVARVQALLRRTSGELRADGGKGTAAASGFSVDDATQRVVYRAGNATTALLLTSVEFRLMRLLISRPGYVFSRDRMLEALHEDFRDVSDRAVDSHIKNVRKKIEAVGADPTCIASVYGVGYRFDAAGGR